jgi:hypothetical protein
LDQPRIPYLSLALAYLLNHKRFYKVAFDLSLQHKIISISAAAPKAKLIMLNFLLMRLENCHMHKKSWHKKKRLKLMLTPLCVAYLVKKKVYLNICTSIGNSEPSLHGLQLIIPQIHLIYSSLYTFDVLAAEKI